MILQQHRLITILKARQLGLSWLVIGWGLWLMLFRPAATVLFFSQRDPEAIHLLNFRLHGMCDRLPKWMQPALKTDNEHEIIMANESIGMAFPTTGGRSYTASLIIVDEADHIDDLDKLINAIKPAIDAGGRLILLSTVDKSRPFSPFKRIYKAAKARENSYRAVFLPWHARPGRNAQWYEEQRNDVLTRTGALDDLYQEYPANDIEALAAATVNRRFAAEWLSKIDGSNVAPLPNTGPALPELRTWRAPQPGAAYVIGADPAEGNPQSDESALTVCDLSGAQVASLAGKLEPAIFGGMLAAVSDYYNDAPALVERNNHGHAVILWLKEFSQVQILNGLDGKPGWLTSGRSKPLAYDTAADTLRDTAPEIPDAETLDQLASISTNLSAPEGMHDDRATAWVLAQTALRFCSVGSGPTAAILPPRQEEVGW